MNNLTVFEQDGALLTDSREVAILVEKEHYDLIKSIRSYCGHLADGDFTVSDYFIESSYKDSTGRELPCFLCTKRGCDMIANKMTGKKGVIFTAKYIEAFEKMKDFIEKGVQISKQVSFKEQVECVGVVAGMLRANDASKIMMLGKLYESNGLSTEFLPKYEFNGDREVRSLSELLKRFELGMSARSFNVLLRERGYLEERTRPSSRDISKFKKYNALTEKGLQYGENAMSPQSQQEVQPLYYSNAFEELFDLIVSSEVA
jgi:phage regulatory protein, rha family